MTALDDALNESTVVFGPHQLKAYWRESDLTSDGAINTDTPTDLAEQFDGSMTISHSLADGLPDTVTATGDADASGILTAGLNGRGGLTLSTSGNRAYDAGGGSWDSAAAATTLTAPIPPGALRDDMLIAFVLVDDNTASLVQVATDPKDQWEFLDSAQDAPLAIYAYGKRRWRTGTPQLTLTSDIPVDYMSASIALWARNVNGIPMDYKLTYFNLGNQGATTTTHNVNNAKLDGKGYQIGVWGSASGNAWTVGAGLTQLGNQSANGLTLLTAITALRDSGSYTLTSTQAVANGTAVLGYLSLEPYERPAMDARQYFSPFNRNSPIYGWDRDTADVLASIRTLTSGGPVDTALFDGQMQGITIQGREAEMNAVSKARIAMNRSISLPMVSGYRENCTLDWLATYLMARGGSFVGPAPNRYTRYWAPLYGSLHAHWDSPYGYNAGFFRSTAIPMSTFGLKPPSVVDGKWMTAMYGQQTATRQEEVSIRVGNHLHQMTTDDFPHLYENNAAGPVMADSMSLANSKGRVQFWVRGDAIQSAPTYVAAGSDYIVKGAISLNKSASLGGAFIAYVEFGVASNTRNGYIKMGNDAGGYTSVSFVTPTLPTDGAWHFYGFNWDFAAGSGNVCFDGTVITATTWATNGNNVITEFPSTDAASRIRGDVMDLHLGSHIPISDVLIDFGETYVAGQWTQHYPTPLAPGANAIMRATNIPLQAIAEATAVNAWDTLADVAQSALAAYRCNESDAIEFLPMDYFGEAAQLTSAAVQDTTKNAADMDVDIDPSKTRNVITVQFPDTRVDTQAQPVLQYLSATEIPAGLTQITFTLDVPIVELHGQAVQAGTQWEILNLTASQISTPTLPSTNHYITVNSAADGTGTVIDAVKVKAQFLYWDGTSVTIQFNNTSGTKAYLANNGDQVPFMQILGYGARSSDGYTTVRESSSVAARRERALITELKWLQSRAVANDIALHLANRLSRSQPEIKVQVFGDPRRKPGQLVTLLDVEGTQVSGTWRVLIVEHDTDGPAYVQNLKLTPVDVIGVWDSTAWDHSVWGE